MNNEEFEIDIIPSPHDPTAGAHVGIRIRHKILNLTADSASQKTQYANKLNAMQLLEERCLEIDGAKADDNTFK
jgi:protein subunit release factor A